MMASRQALLLLARCNELDLLALIRLDIDEVGV